MYFSRTHARINFCQPRPPTPPLPPPPNPNRPRYVENFSVPKSRTKTQNGLVVSRGNLRTLVLMQQMPTAPVLGLRYTVKRPNVGLVTDVRAQSRHDL